MTRGGWTAVATLVALAACDDGGGSKTSGGQTQTASPSATVVGLDAPGNDAQVVELARRVLACPIEADAPKPDCPALTSWRDSELLQGGKADKTVVSLLEDPNERARHLAASTLRRAGASFRTDAALATRVLAAAKKESSDVVGEELGGAVATIDGSATGLNVELGEALRTVKLASLRRSLIASVLVRNPSQYGIVAKLAAEDADVGMRRAAVGSLWAGTPSEQIADSCALWLARASDESDAETAAEAAYSCAAYPQGDGCHAQWDPLLDTLEKMAEAGKVTSARIRSTLDGLRRQGAASAEQKKRALKVGRAVVTNGANGEYARAQTLTWIGETDPEAKAFAKDFLDDAGPAVKSAAERIVTGKK